MKLRAIQGGKSGTARSTGGWPPKDLEQRVARYRRNLVCADHIQADGMLNALLFGIWSHGYATAIKERP